MSGPDLYVCERHGTSWFDGDEPCPECRSEWVAAEQKRAADWDALRADNAALRAQVDENAADVMRLQGELAELRATLAAKRREWRIEGGIACSRNPGAPYEAWWSFAARVVDAHWPEDAPKEGER